ncbi:MAG: hypothetical protein LBM75_07005, partial [Myxococcales bacterium]|nr:hypothetical protein [Myxococcales bacterium]
GAVEDARVVAFQRHEDDDAAAEELLSRPVLEGTILALDLFPDLRRAEGSGEGSGMEAALARLRGMLDVRIPHGTQTIELIVEGPDPKEIAAIASELTRRYAESVVRLRTAQAEDILQILDAELRQVTGEVEAIEARILDFKRAHQGMLPEQLESNMRGLERLIGVQVARVESKRELTRRLADLEAGRTGVETRLGRLRRQSFELQSALALAQSQWQPGHPEVQRLRRELERSEERLRQAEFQTNEQDLERTFLRREVALLDTELKAVDRESRFYRDRLDGTPSAAQALFVLDRDYELLRAKYQSLLSRKVEAEVARNLERVAGPRMFRVLTPPTVPMLPHSPNRVNALAVILALALAISLLVAIVRTLADDSLQSIEDARGLEVPILALVPKIDGRAERRREA